MRQVSEACRALLGVFPRAPHFAFAYGSAALPQTRNAPEPMLDLVLAVRDPVEWHEANLAANPHHYSALGRLGGAFLANYQRCGGAHVYYNTLVPMPNKGGLFKYGVVAVEDLVRDLRDWTKLYLAGRLHKPVHFIVPAQDLASTLEHNDVYALRAALLSLPENFTRLQLHTAVASLSYSGDFRMILGESKTKVRDIVVPQTEMFALKYSPALAALSDSVVALGDDSFAQNVSPVAKLTHLKALPAAPRKLIGEARLVAASQGATAAIVSRALRRIVWNSSVSQSLKGILTAGVVKSVVYGTRKIKKSFH